MAIKHQKTAIPDVDKVNCVDWNADHTGTATPDNHGNEVHTPDFQEVLPIGSVLMYNGVGWVNNVTMVGWYQCDGNNGTPNLTNKFIRCELTSGNTGGSDTQANHPATACSRTTDVALTNNHSVTQPSSHAATACTRTTDVALTNNHAGTAVAAHGITQPTFTYPNHRHISGNCTANSIQMRDAGDVPRNIAVISQKIGTGATTAFGTLGATANYYTDTSGGGSCTRTTDVALTNNHSVTQPSAHAITQPAFNTPILSHSGTDVAAHAITQPTFDTPILTHGTNMPAYYSLIFIIRMS